MNQADRLKKLLVKLGVNQAGFARALGISKGQITNILNGEREISNILALAITAVYKDENVNPTWLLTGEGGMFLSDTSATLSDRADNDNNAASEIIVEWVDGLPNTKIRPVESKKSKTKSADVVSLEGLTDEQRQIVISLVKNMKGKK